MAEKKHSKKKKKYRQVDVIMIHIKTSFNNTIVVVTDNSGNKLVGGSAGEFYNNGTRKSTAFAAQQVMRKVLKDAVAKFGARKVSEVRLKGPGSAREAAVRAIKSELDVYNMAIKDVTPVPHNGCRPPKKRRV